VPLSPRKTYLLCGVVVDCQSHEGSGRVGLIENLSQVAHWSERLGRDEVRLLVHGDSVARSKAAPDNARFALE
jgi:hypothetical protein